MKSLLTKPIIADIQESLVQKHDRLLDLAALDAIPIEILPILTPQIQKAKAKINLTVRKRKLMPKKF